MQELVEQVLMVAQAGVADVVARVVSPVAGWLCTKAKGQHSRPAQAPAHAGPHPLDLYCVVAEATGDNDGDDDTPPLKGTTSSTGPGCTTSRLDEWTTDPRNSSVLVLTSAT
jgi:hypothetical protein